MEFDTCRDVAADVSNPPEVVLLSAVLVNVLTESALESATLIGDAALVASEVIPDWLPESAMDVPVEFATEARVPDDTLLESAVETRMDPLTDLLSATLVFTLTLTALESATLMSVITFTAVLSAAEMLPITRSAVLIAVETAVERR